MEKEYVLSPLSQTNNRKQRSLVIFSESFRKQEEEIKSPRSLVKQSTFVCVSVYSHF